MIFPQDDLEFRLNWTHKAAENSVLGGMVNRVRQRAGEFYIRKQGAEADAMMQLADAIERDAKLAHQELAEYIAEDGRREAEFRRVMKAPRPEPKLERGDKHGKP